MTTDNNDDFTPCSLGDMAPGVALRLHVRDEPAPIEVRFLSTTLEPMFAYLAEEDADDQWVMCVVSGRTKMRGVGNERLAIGQHVACQLSRLELS